MLLLEKSRACSNGIAFNAVARASASVVELELITVTEVDLLLIGSPVFEFNVWEITLLFE